MTGEVKEYCPNCAERNALKNAIYAVILGSDRDNAIWAMVELILDEITSTTPDNGNECRSLTGVIEHLTCAMRERLEEAGR